MAHSMIDGIELEVRLDFSLGQDELFRCDMKHKACELIPLNESRIQ